MRTLSLDLRERILVSYDNGENKRFWIEPWTNSDLRNENDWPRQHEWLRVKLERLIAAMSKHLVTPQ